LKAPSWVCCSQVTEPPRALTVSGRGNLELPLADQRHAAAQDAAALQPADRRINAIGAELIEPAIDQVIAHCLLRVAAGLALSTAKPRALSQHRRKPSGIGVPERVHFTEF
jgi:hypothetical protein